MVAVSRFVEFSVTSTTFATGSSTEAVAQGTRGFSRGTSLGAGDDSFTITLNSNDQLAVNINSVGPETITLASGTDLDPRFVARDIAFKLHSANADDAFKFAQCDWSNGTSVTTNPGPNAENAFIIYSGKLANNGGNNDVNVTDPGGGRDARSTLGWSTLDERAGVDFATDFGSGYTGVAAVSGSFGGQFDDFYTALISDGELVANAVADGGNTYTGTATTDGMYIGAADDTYTVTIDTTNGSTMGAGSTNVPTFQVTDAPGGDDNSSAIELLYPDHLYEVGDLGVRIKFSDAVFGNGDIFTINAFTASGTGYPKAVAAAKYIFSSTRGDSSKVLGIGATTTQVVGTQLGSVGVTLQWSDSGVLDLGERFNVTCRGPQPTDSNVTQLNFGNVTVSTNSPVKVVWFELISGAVSMSTVKFSLQSDGSFAHHDQGDTDTEFHYGTSGADNDAPGGGPTSNSQVEFAVDSNGVGAILATDIDSDSPPSNLFATKADLAVVNSADNAETVGNFQGAVVSDFMFLAVKLGANETGANSTINYRMFFDFS